MTAKKKNTKKAPVKKAPVVPVVTTAPVVPAVPPVVTAPVVPAVAPVVTAPSGAKRGPKPGTPRAPLAVQPITVKQETAYGMSKIKMFQATWKGEKKIFTQRPAANAWIKEQKVTFKVPTYAKTFKNLHGKLLKMDRAEIPQEKYPIMEALKSAYEMLAEPYYNLTMTAENTSEAVTETPIPTAPVQQPIAPEQPAQQTAGPLSFLAQAATPPLPSL